MYMILSKKGFLDSLSIGSLFAGGKIAATSNIKLKVKGGTLSVVSTDGNNFISQKMDGSVESDGDMAFCIEPGPLLGYVKSITDESITIDVSDGHAVIKHSNGKIELPVFSGDELVGKVAEQDMKSIEVDSEMLCKWIGNGSRMLTKDILRPILNGVYIYKQGCELGCCANNMIAMYHAHCNISSDGDVDDFGFVIDSACLKAISTAFATPGKLTMRVGKRSAIIKNAVTTMSCALIEGTYPNFKSVINKSVGKSHICFDRNEFVLSLGRCSFGMDIRGTVLLESNESGHVDISCSDMDMGKSASETIKADVLEGTSISFSYGYIKTIMSCLGGDEAHMSIAGDNLPVIISDADGDGNEIYVLMPVLFNCPYK